jgi:hypothetical protein
MINSKLALKATEAFESKNSSNITQDSNTCCISLIGAKPRTTFKYQGYQMPVYRWVMIAIDGYLEPSFRTNPKLYNELILLI